MGAKNARKIGKIFLFSNTSRTQGLKGVIGEKPSLSAARPFASTDLALANTRELLVMQMKVGAQHEHLLVWRKL